MSSERPNMHVGHSRLCTRDRETRARWRFVTSSDGENDNSTVVCLLHRTAIRCRYNSSLCGYEQGPSIKGNAPLRRGQNMYPVIRFTTRYQIHSKQEMLTYRNSEGCSGDISFTHKYANRRRHRYPGFSALLSCKATLEESLLQIRQDNRKYQSGEHQLSER